MDVDTSHDQGSPGQGQEGRHSDQQSGGGALRWQVVAWLVLSVALLLWIATGSVATTTYTYNQFLQMTFRNENDTPIQEIWAYQAEHLPDVQLQWALDSAFVVSIVVIIACVIAGSWLLLVRASDPSSRRRSRLFVPPRST